MLDDIMKEKPSGLPVDWEAAEEVVVSAALLLEALPAALPPFPPLLLEAAEVAAVEA
jgi:hypothetical protein